MFIQRSAQGGRDERAAGADVNLVEVCEIELQWRCARCDEMRSYNASPLMPMEVCERTIAIGSIIGVSEAVVALVAAIVR